MPPRIFGLNSAGVPEASDPELTAALHDALGLKGLGV